MALKPFAFLGLDLKRDVWVRKLFSSCGRVMSTAGIIRFLPAFIIPGSIFDIEKWQNKHVGGGMVSSWTRAIVHPAVLPNLSAISIERCEVSPICQQHPRVPNSRCKEARCWTGLVQLLLFYWVGTRCGECHNEMGKPDLGPYRMLKWCKRRRILQITYLAALMLSDPQPQEKKHLGNNLTKANFRWCSSRLLLSIQLSNSSLFWRGTRRALWKGKRGHWGERPEWLLLLTRSSSKVLINVYHTSIHSEEPLLWNSQKTLCIFALERE